MCESSERQAGAGLCASAHRLAGDVTLHYPQSAVDGVQHMPKSGKDRLIWNNIDFGKEYVWGRINVAIHCKTKALRGGENGPIINGRKEGFCGDLFFSGQIDQKHAVDVADVDDRSNRSMFIRTIERVHGVEEFPVARWVCRKLDQQIFHTLRGCYHSTNRGFEIHPSSANNELKLLVLASAVKPDQIPHGMVERTPQVMNGIPEYEWQMERKGLIDEQLYPDIGELPVLSLTFDNRSVWAEFDPSQSGGLEVADMLLGPL